MARVLYLAHRLPFPPDKGDKVRSHHILRELSARHNVRLGTFVDDADDLRHVGFVATLCDELYVRRLWPIPARLRALRSLLGVEPASLAYYRDRALHSWVTGLCARGVIDVVVVSSSSMAPYVEDLNIPILMDFIDVDSQKWLAYGNASHGPARWLFHRESRTLSQYERLIAAKATRAYFVSKREADLFRGSSPDMQACVDVLENGVDAEHFAPRSDRPSPYPANELSIAFSGTMNYRPNVDAVGWFAESVLPVLRQSWPTLKLTVVGRHPVAAVRRLEGASVRVTGTVEDVRPWLQHAAVIVAPMRMSRGVQNKVLEAMAMGRPVVVAADCAAALDVVSGQHVLAATGASEFTSAVNHLLAAGSMASGMGEAARAWVQKRYTWSGSLEPLRRTLAQLELEAG